MASFGEVVTYPICQSFSEMLQIESFETNPLPVEQTVSSADESVKIGVTLFSKGLLQLNTNFVFIHLKCLIAPPDSVMMFDVSVIDVKEKKQFTLYLGRHTAQLQNQKEQILARLCIRGNILDSPSTYLRNGTLKVRFEVIVMKQGPSLQLTPLSKDYASLLKTGSLSDVTLLVGNRKFPVHKLILSARSPVFARMLTSNFRESKENRVVIEDMSEEVLQELLNFIYTARVDNLEKHASELLMVAEKYQIESLKEICGQSLCATLNTDTLLSLLQMATLYNAPQLKNQCLAYFTEHSKEIKLTAEWEQLIITESNLELLGLLLKSVMRTE